MISEILIGKTFIDRANIKKDAIKAALDNILALSNAWEFEDNKKRKVVIEQVKTEILKGRANPIWFKISVNGKYLNGDGWYGFVNPPIMVASGTKSQIIDELSGEKFLVDNFQEDILMATKSIILQVVGGV